MKQTLCQHCGVRPATVFYRENKNGVERELHLCPECAAQLGIGDFQENLFSSFSLFAPHAEPKKITACPLCGTTLDRIRHSGKFGCSTCYDTFAKMLDLTPYVGKGYDGKSAEPPAEQQTPTAQKAQINELDALRAELKQAVAAEDYEKAAVLRDKIRAKEEK